MPEEEIGYYDIGTTPAGGPMPVDSQSDAMEGYGKLPAEGASVLDRFVRRLPELADTLEKLS